MDQLGRLREKKLIVTVCKSIGRYGAGCWGRWLGSGGTTQKHGMKWITTRRPTEKDPNWDGDVFVKSHPDNEDGVYLHWSIVPAGMAWRTAGVGGPDPAPEPVPPGEPWPLPRLFAAPIRRTFTPSGRMVLDAIADDGTAWAAWISAETGPSAIRWHQIPPLPQPEAE